ncbi:MAG: alkaline phosphatase [Desulfobacterales bacterium]|nr:alkaline phosphatase [Desulfobacterales bacterium]
MKKILSLISLFLFILISPAHSGPSQNPKYVFYFIGDGMGASQREFAQLYLREESRNPHATLSMNQLEVAGLTSTIAADTLVTDSAAAATALATGVKTNKGVVSISPKGKKLITLMEAAEAKGMATGLITTTRLTHATPAAFAAHAPSRDMENEIAEELVRSGVDFMAGGGIRHFIPQGMGPKDITGKAVKSKRNDDKNLFSELRNRGYATFIGKAGAHALETTDFTSLDRAVIALTRGHLPFEIDRKNQLPHTPSLADLTRMGIQVLSRDPDGFVVMVEGGRIDHACHVNDPVGAIHDTLALDRAVEQAREFARRHPDETLILVVGDHETGGLGMGMDPQGYALNMAALVPATTSLGRLHFGPARYQGDPETFIHRLETQYGLSQMTATERVALHAAMADSDAGKKAGFYNYDPAALTAARLLSTRANIYWTATIHTATMIPLAASGPQAMRFTGFKDNTFVARTLAEVLHLDL